MAAGFSYGGWTALLLGGARGNLAGYADHCRTFGNASSNCADMAAAGLDLTSYAATDWDAAYADPRITHVTAIDPGPIWGMQPADAADLIGNVRLIGLGDGTDRLLATDFDHSGFAAMVPQAQIDRITPANHFTGFPLCTPMAAEILREEQDDPVCTDPAGTDRAAAHDQIIDAIAGDLGL